MGLALSQGLTFFSAAGGAAGGAAGLFGDGFTRGSGKRPGCGSAGGGSCGCAGSGAAGLLPRPNKREKSEPEDDSR
jgi:hypothetical protein